jgi:hypothetical protein
LGQHGGPDPHLGSYSACPLLEPPPVLSRTPRATDHGDRRGTPTYARPVQMFHGTTAAVAEAIRVHGLVEPWPGRGVSATPDRAYAKRVAEAACLRERADRGGDERETLGLLVTVDLVGLECWPCGTFDPQSLGSVVTAHVPAERVESVETVAVVLPRRGCLAERWALAASGCAVRRPGWRDERTFDRARQLALSSLARPSS